MLVASSLYLLLLSVGWLLRARHVAGSWPGQLLLPANVLGFTIGYLGITRILARRAVAAGPWTTFAIWLAAGVIGGFAGWPLPVNSSERVYSVESTVMSAFVFGLWVSQRRRPRPVAPAP